MNTPTYTTNLTLTILYGLRTNSLLLLGLCVGWVFAVLSFTDGNNLRYQLTFGLVNGLQGIFLFFFHCLLNSDHVKGYSGGSKRCLDESGRSPTNDSTRSKIREEAQSGGSGRRKGGSRNSKLENVPLISVSNISKPDDKSQGANDHPIQDSPPMPIKSDSVHITEKDDVICHVASISPDLDIVPQLPGTPDPQIERLELLSSKKGQKRGDGSGTSRSKRPKTADNLLQVHHSKVDSKSRKSSSEPTISSGQFDTTRGRERTDRRVPGMPSDYFPDVRPKRTDRPLNSTNELESLFSGTGCFTKKSHCSSLSSLPTRERRISNQERQRKSSSTTDAHTATPYEGTAPSSSPRSANETIL